MYVFFRYTARQTRMAAVDVDDPGNNAVIEFKASEVLKSSSIVWNFLYFKGTKEAGPSKDKVYCRLCNDSKRGTITYSRSTTNLKEHIKVHHPIELRKEEEKDSKSKKASYVSPIGNFFSKSDSKNTKKWDKNSAKSKEATEALAKWLCLSSRPSYIVEDEGFKKLISLLCPEYEVPSHQTMTRKIQKLYEEEKKLLVAKLEKVEYGATTTDGGSSSNAVSYQCTNFHFIDEDMRLQHVCLGVKQNKETHTAENYRENNDEVLQEFGVKEKVVLTVTDNENKMKAAFPDDERNGCIAHQMHTSVGKGMDASHVVDSTVKKIRKIATKHNTSYVMRCGLEEEQKKRGLKIKPLLQDVPTRWGSTRQSTASFLDADEADSEDDEEKASTVFKDTFKNMEAVNAALRKVKMRKGQKLSDYILTEDEMEIIQVLNKFLTKLDIFSTTLGGAKFVTSSVVMPVVKAIEKLCEPAIKDPGYLATMKSTIKEDFKTRTDKNLNLLFLLKATALDPRFKSMKVLEDKAEREAVFKLIKHEVNQMEVKEKTSEPENEMQGQNQKKRKLGLVYDESDDEDDVVDEDKIEREITNYRKEAKQDQDHDPLDWWRTRQASYPLLSRLVRYCQEYCTYCYSIFKISLGLLDHITAEIFKCLYCK